ncbi:hypothetical protein Rumi1_07420 [[Ruminococcus] torques]|nr:hypothetical protein Rumi1_07420 [[Ruminococcus] torques]
MQLLVYISNYIVPFLILSIIVYGLSAKVNVYETFIKGAKSGFFTVVRIMPTLIGLMAAVGILRASGSLISFPVCLKTLPEGSVFPANSFRLLS